MGEQSLFDDLPPPVNKNVTEPEKTEPVEPPSIKNAEADSDWLDDFEIIEDLIGEEAARKIAESFAGSTIYIPKNILTARNHHDIRRKFKAGKTYRELSVEYSYTETHIRNIVHKK
jgi:Mor family transcriptional regulator